MDLERLTDGLSMRYGTVDEDYHQRMATIDAADDGPIWMVNLMRYRDRAEYADGRATDLTGQQADDLYAPLDSIAAVGGDVVFFGEVESQLLGDQPPWHRVAVVRYPTRRSFVEMHHRDDFREHHVHKDAGMDSTIILSCQPFDHPAEPPGGLADWEAVEHPPSDDDPPIVVVHVVAFDHSDDVVRSVEHMSAYSDAAALVAVPYGVRISGWFDVEAVAVGDGRPWDQVRFNAFPSRAAFMAVVFDPARLDAQKEHRETAMVDTYTMIVRPHIDRLADSIGGRVGHGTRATGSER